MWKKNVFYNWIDKIIYQFEFSKSKRLYLYFLILFKQFSKRVEPDTMITLRYEGKKLSNYLTREICHL